MVFFGCIKHWILAQLSTVSSVFLLIVNSINFIDGIDGLAISQFIMAIIEFFSYKFTELFFTWDDYNFFNYSALLF